MISCWIAQIDWHDAVRNSSAPAISATATGSVPADVMLATATPDNASGKVATILRALTGSSMRL
jgi:hypothetical protein